MKRVGDVQAAWCTGLTFDLHSYNRSQRDALYFSKELYIFQTDSLSIIRSLDSVFTAVGICNTGYVDCLLARSGWAASPSETSLPK